MRWSMVKQEKSKVWILFGAALILSCFPLFTADIKDAHDISFHINRIIGLCEAVRDGQFPALIQPDLNNGYGYAALALYPGLFLYIPAVMVLLGMPAVFAYKIFLVFINAGTFLIMYGSMRTLSCGRKNSALCSFIYTLSVYRLGCIFIRGALGEVLGMCFFPLIVAGGYELLSGDRKRWPLLVIGATGILQSHIISTFLALCVGIVMIWMYRRNVVREKRWKELLLFCACTFILNLWFLVPFLDFYRQPLNLNIQGSGKGIYYLNTIIPAQLFNLLGDNFGIAYTPEHGILGEMSMTPGMSVFLGLALLTSFIAARMNSENSRFIGRCWCTALALLLLSTSILPWEKLQNIGIINKAAGWIQFPMRLLGPASVLILTGTALVLESWEVLSVKVRRAVSYALIISALIPAIMIGIKVFRQNTFMNALEAVPQVNAMGLGKEYLMQGTDDALLYQEGISADRSVVTIENYHKTGTHITFSYVNEGENQRAELPLLWYPGYTVKDENGEVLKTAAGENNVLCVLLKDYSEGAVRVKYGGKTAYRLAAFGSAAGALVMTVWWIGRKKRKASDETD